ncbi:MAG: thiamine-phosphate kinase [Rhodovarius sp.]|nr:thiamine-phosphate kinase [Rhodovarius sp.]
MSLPAEFALIARHFAPLAHPGGLGLLDDAALLTPPAGRELVLAADAMVAGVHFLPNDPPETVGRKLLRVNLSDLAAMGAEPIGYLMTIALPREIGEDWLDPFARGLAEDQRGFGLALFGGDTVSTSGPLVLSLTILGSVEPGRALRRAGARPGDAVWVTGTIGDGWLGLRAARGELPDPEARIAARYRLPTPRLAEGRALIGIAHACMDVSDGLVQDLGHICRASGCGAVIEAARIPLSPWAAGADIRDLIAGGDDYELLFAAPPEAPVAELGATRIGRFIAGPPEVTVLDAKGAVLPLSRQGWSHR